MKYFIAYFSIISLMAVIMTVSDKSRAKKNKWRIPEKTLFVTAALGGAAAMYITMLVIRHKTKHKRFMIGLPLIILAQAVIAALICIKLNVGLPVILMTFVKEKFQMKYFMVYLLIISLTAIIITVSDKSRAKKHKLRIPENILFITAVLGGAAAMYITMLTIRHMTKRKRFMIGLPLIILVQIGVGILIYIKLNGELPYSLSLLLHN